MSRVLAAVAIGVIGLSIGAGLIATGGPAEGRHERQDQQRRSDLRAVSLYLKCGGQDVVLPSSLDDAEFCPGRTDRDFLYDPATGDVYQYQRHDDHRFEVCTRLVSRLERTHGPRFYDAKRFISKADGRICVEGTRRD